jgi:hypothetical protein
VGTLVGLPAGGSLLVDYPGNPAGPVAARSTVKVTPRALGREVVLIFESGDTGKPVVLGVVQDIGAAAPGAVEVTADGETLFVSAGREIVLRCGKASITLTRAGKVLIRGEYVLSRSEGVNRIKGGAVQIN